MSSVKQWLTKEQMLRDLARVSGRQVARVEKLDEGYIVIGDAPPPLMFKTEDDEMLHQFGDVIHERASNMQYDEVPEPDLNGITKMIRMVQRSDGESDEDILSNVTQPKCVIAISKVSKLNPDVKEFVPKSALSSHSSSSLGETKAGGDFKSDGNDAEVNTNDDISIENRTPNVNEELATKLKNEISDASKSNCFEIKKQKNVAIATLLRLYTSNNKSSKTTKPVKLITPDYYENPSPIKELENATPVSATTTPDPKSLSSSAISESSNDVKSEPILSTQDAKGSPSKPVLDPAIKKSIEKVNQWMGEPVERKSPAVFLSPVAFKRKECTSTTSTRTEQTEQKRPAICHQNQYKPSNYAADLGRKYMERSKIKEKQNINSWSDLDVLLKERDAIVTRKLLEQRNDSNDDSDAPSD